MQGPTWGRSRENDGFKLAVLFSQTFPNIFRQPSRVFEVTEAHGWLSSPQRPELHRRYPPPMLPLTVKMITLHLHLAACTRLLNNSWPEHARHVHVKHRHFGKLLLALNRVPRQPLATAVTS